MIQCRGTQRTTGSSSTHINWILTPPELQWYMIELAGDLRLCGVCQNAPILPPGYEANTLILLQHHRNEVVALDWNDNNQRDFQQDVKILKQALYVLSL